MENTLFRKKVVDKISSPEQLTDYLRVTNPSIWLVLSAVVFILIGIISWSFVGVLTTKVEASAVVYDGGANIVPIDTEWSICAGLLISKTAALYRSCLYFTKSGDIKLSV